ncbi:MAG: SLC13 family permease [Planctomycetaceae bacterium]
MNYELIVTLIVLAAILVGLLQDAIGAEMVMLAGLTILVLAGVVDVDSALAGFANPSVVTIGALYVVGTGLRSTGALETISQWLFGRPRPGVPLVRYLAPISGLSAFMNNTPLVAFFLPVFIQLAKRLRVSPSKLLIPLSYAAILGGCCTLVGTSTNLVVDGILRKLPADQGGGAMSMFELTPAGLPMAIVGLAYLVTIGIRLLPNRQDLMEYIETHPREYSVEMVVRQGCPLAGQSVRTAGLRDLPGLYLYRIERGAQIIAAVGPNDVMQVGDILSFSGVAATVVDLQKIRGLDPVEHRSQMTAPESAAPELAAPGPAATPMASLDSLEGLPAEKAEAAPAAPRTGRQLCEVVVSSTSPLLEQSIKDADFRTRYRAVIIAVHRSGEKLQQKIGQIVLRVGDTLLIDAGDDFVRRWRHSPDFILVSGVEDSAPVRHERAWLALTIFGLVVLGMSLASDSARINPTVVAVAGGVLMVLTRCVRTQEATRSVELSVLVLVAAALGIGKAMETSGAAKWLASGLLSACADSGPVVVMAVLYLMTVILSELLSNNATAALMGTLAVQAALQRQIDARPFLIAVAIASSCAFATPIGYQTNLMVLNPGGYRFADYLKVGLPLNVLCFVIAVIVIPLVWSF